MAMPRYTMPRVAHCDGGQLSITVSYIRQRSSIWRKRMDVARLGLASRGLAR